VFLGGLSGLKKLPYAWKKIPHGMGDLYAAQVVCVGSHWFRVLARHHDQLL
jgi:hypothetical protein